MRLLALTGWILLLLGQAPTYVEKKDFHTLERRVIALEAWRDATVTATKDWATEIEHPGYVDLKRRIQRIERELGLLR